MNATSTCADDTGPITTMPGLPSHPHAAQIDLDPEGKITRLV
jgi:formyltetrahydrofolate synthetase